MSRSEYLSDISGSVSKYSGMLLIRPENSE